MDSDHIVREQLLALLKGGNAHMGFEAAIAEFPMDRINEFPPGCTYSAWHLLEHLRIAQWDILEFIRDPAHESPEWPSGYWPESGAEADAARWDQTIQEFQSDLKDLTALVEAPEVDLYEDLPHAEGYTVLREVLVVADHNAYHIGEFAILRQVMGTWP